MQRVERWLCGYCKKEFKTPNKHFCRKDPANKSCASCGNRQWEWESDDDWSEYQIPYCQWAADNGTRDCTLRYLSKHPQDWFEIRKLHFIVNCQHWIPIPYIEMHGIEKED